MQEGEFDIFIADMNENPKYMFDNYLCRSGLERLRHQGRQYLVENIQGTNQLYGYNAGLRHANEHGYEICLAGDDDLIYEPGWIKKGVNHMNNDQDLGVCVGMTLSPRQSLEEQSLGVGMDPACADNPDFDGTLSRGLYCHCIFVPMDKTPKYYEQVYGGFFFRTADAIAVRGFPTFLSPLGFRGEMMLQSAIHFLGRKLMVDPTMLSWHYQANYGGLRFDDKIRAKYVEEDLKIWNSWLAKKLPLVEKPEIDLNTCNAISK